MMKGERFPKRRLISVLGLACVTCYDSSKTGKANAQTTNHKKSATSGSGEVSLVFHSPCSLFFSLSPPLSLSRPSWTRAPPPPNSVT